MIWLIVVMLVLVVIVANICMARITALGNELEAARRYSADRDEVACQRIFTIHNHLGVSEGLIERKDVLVAKHTAGRGKKCLHGLERRK